MSKVLLLFDLHEIQSESNKIAAVCWFLFPFCFGPKTNARKLSSNEEKHNEKSYKFAEQMVEILTRVSVCHSHVCEIKNELTATGNKLEHIKNVLESVFT